MSRGFAKMDDDDSLALIDAATELGWVVQVPMRVVDRRQRHRFGASITKT
jgi:hypothetical protein